MCSVTVCRGKKGVYGKTLIGKTLIGKALIGKTLMGKTLIGETLIGRNTYRKIGKTRVFMLGHGAGRLHCWPERPRVRAWV